MEDRKLNARERWPEAFEGLSDLQAHALEEVLASTWLEGVDPTAEHVQDLVAETRGESSVDEFKDRVLRRAGVR
ncbi:antitoxin VbhA family protein [Arthrobacter woluwensis]|uniref:antitoxin VbhA family protein n=1 Tax=Arthrobacter woluwensis TaxID=156980 RepID=UPI0037FDB2A1